LKQPERFGIRIAWNLHETMQLNKTYLFCVCAATVLDLAAISANATGFDLPDQDAFAIARGMAFVATADNPSAIYYNPAGISQLDGNNVRVGVYGLYLDPTYKSPSSPSSTFHNEENWHAIPQFFYTYRPQELPLSFGLGMYAPFGLSSRWPQDTGFRTVATEATLTYYTINPVVAWRITTNFSIAAGITVDYAQADLQRGLVWPNQANDLFRFKGDGWTAGYNLGVLWKPHEKISVGATFRSTTSINLDGRTEYYNNVAFPPGVPPQFQVPAFPRQTVKASTDFDFPLKAIVGISFRPTPSWNFEFDADYTDWTRVGTLNVKQANGFPPLLPQNIPLKLNWESSWYYEFGATRYFGNGWSISAGYIFNENSVPDANYTPLVADLDRHFLSIGAGFKGTRFDFDVAYQFGYGPTRTVTGSGFSATGQTADGRYDFISHAVVLSVGLHF
jgi:long-chain fatty acid transport protein